MERRLAAILAADVVGYSRLMGADETGTLEALRTLRTTLFDPTIEAHHGRVVKLMGDGALVEFASVVDAVNCAVEVQKALAARAEGSLQLRIGINLGDVIVDGDDIYGDGVNVAARLEGIADPGGICVSEAVAAQARGKVQTGFEDLGFCELKNIAEPVHIWRVGGETAAVTSRTEAPSRSRQLVLVAVAAVLLCAVAGAGWLLTRPATAAVISADKVLTVKGPAVAMLSFTNRSGDKTYDDFAAGMSEQIAASLTRFNGIRVLSLRASAKYAKDLDAMRSKLGADYLLDGAVRRDSKQIQITAVLTKLPAGDQIWTDTFKAEVVPGQIMDVEEKLAGKIAGSLGQHYAGAIAGDRVADRRGRAPTDQMSLDCALSRNYFYTPKLVFAGYACIRRALDRDPNYAFGWARLTQIYQNMYIQGLRPDDDPDFDPKKKILEAAQKAVELAPHSAIARYRLALSYFFNGDHGKFLTEANNSISLNPNDSNSIAWLGTLIAFTGRWDEGNALVEKAVAFNPTVVSSVAWYGPAKAHFLREEYSESLKDFQRVWSEYPGYWLNYLNAAYLYGAWGKQAEAEGAVAALLEKKPGYTIEDAVAYYRLWQFQPSFIDKMATALKKAGLPLRRS